MTKKLPSQRALLRSVSLIGAFWKASSWKVKSSYAQLPHIRAPSHPPLIMQLYPIMSGEV